MTPLQHLIGLLYTFDIPSNRHGRSHQRRPPVTCSPRLFNAFTTVYFLQGDNTLSITSVILGLVSAQKLCGKKARYQQQQTSPGSTWYVILALIEWFCTYLSIPSVMLGLASRAEVVWENGNVRLGIPCRSCVGKRPDTNNNKIVQAVLGTSFLP